MVTILALSGSLREASFNTMLLKNARDHAPSDVAIEMYNGLASLPLFSEDLEGPNLPVAVVNLWRQVCASDGLLIATPEYSQSFSGVIKNAIDWIVREPDEAIDGKPVAVIGATTGQWGTRLAQSALRSVLHSAGAHLVPLPQLYVRSARQVFDEQGALVDPSTRNALSDLVRAFSEWIAANGARKVGLSAIGSD